MGRFIAGFDQIDRVQCAVQADNWLSEYGADADNKIYISDVQVCAPRAKRHSCRRPTDSRRNSTKHHDQKPSTSPRGSQRTAAGSPAITTNPTQAGT